MGHLGPRLLRPYCRTTRTAHKIPTCTRQNPKQRIITFIAVSDVTCSVFFFCQTLNFCRFSSIMQIKHIYRTFNNLPVKNHWVNLTNHSLNGSFVVLTCGLLFSKFSMIQFDAITFSCRSSISKITVMQYSCCTAVYSKE